MLLNPQATETSRIDMRVLVSSTRAYCRRSIVLSCTTEQPMSLRTSRSSWRNETSTRRAISGTPSGSSMFDSMSAIAARTLGFSSGVWPPSV